jgi:hypothetical protein
MNTSAYMTIQFLRNGKDAQDDWIGISRVGYDEYRVEMILSKQFLTPGSTAKTATTFSFDDLKSYLRNLFHLLSIDQDPYEFYQFDLPLMPSVLVKHTRLLELEESVLSILEDYDSNDTWPQRTYPEKKPMPRHIFFDEEDGHVIEERY